MAHTGYNLSLTAEIVTQSGLEARDFSNVKDSGGKKGQSRITDAMDAVVAHIKTQSNGPGVFTETSLSGGGWTVEQDVSAASGSSTGTGLDNLPAGIKKLVQTSKFTGVLDYAGATGGHYWVTTKKLYRFKNRNQRDQFQQCLAARLSIDTIADLTLSGNKNINDRVNIGSQDKVTLKAKKSTATTNFDARVAAIINSGSGVAG